MKEELVTFRGVNEGVFINIQSDNMVAIMKEIKEKMENSLSFYRGTNIIGIRGEKLSPKDVLEIRFMLKYEYGFTILKDRNVEINVKDGAQEENTEDVFEGIECGMTRFINGTIRSGQVEIYTGNIVIIGDVNPGGLIQAKGNIVVLGSLRGVAHAGMGGNREAIVAAYDFQPTQLRIADIIVRPPDDGVESYKLPEIAKIKDGKVIIEPYLPNK